MKSKFVESPDKCRAFFVTKGKYDRKTFTRYRKMFIGKDWKSISKKPREERHSIIFGTVVKPYTMTLSEAIKEKDISKIPQQLIKDA